MFELFPLQHTHGGRDEFTGCPRGLASRAHVLVVGHGAAASLGDARGLRGSERSRRVPQRSDLQGDRRPVITNLLLPSAAGVGERGKSLYDFFGRSADDFRER